MRVFLIARPLLLVAALLLMAGCSGGDDGGGGGDSAGKPAESAVKIEVSPAADATKITPDTDITVKARDGKLTKVTVTGRKSGAVKGSLDSDGKSWSAKGILELAERYTVVAVGVDDDGREKTTKSTFRTIVPDKRLRTAVVPLRGETVGVGLPIQVSFNAAVSDREAVQRGLQVVSTPKVTGAWHWIDSKKVRYRPKTYWPAGTKVTLKVRLKGVDAGKGVYGDERRDVPFTIGRSLVSVVDAKRLTMTVVLNGKPIRTIPITAGKTGFETRNGIKVVLEKTANKIMDGATVGIPTTSPEYYRLTVPYAVRVTWSGEFVHGAPWSVGSQGTTRVSHGCVGMNVQNAQWYFGQSLRGDVVQVVGSPTTRTMELDNGFGDWNVPWATWVAGSAVPVTS